MDIAEQVSAILHRCFFTDEEAVQVRAGTFPLKPVHVSGVMLRLGFHPERVQAEKEKIKALLDQMPLAFHRNCEGGGEGYSFLNLCETRTGEQWGEHRNMDELLMLAMATEQGGFCLTDPKMWEMFPGGMPYIWFDTSGKEPTTEDTELTSALKAGIEN